MPAAVALPAIVGALGVGGQIFGTAKQAGAAKRASQEQESARREALAFERQRETGRQKAAQSRWNQYRDTYQQWLARYGDKGLDRYGMAPGMKYGAPAGAPGGGVVAPGQGGTPRTPVTLAGGRQVDPGEYDEYVKQREARRGQTLGQMAGMA